MAYVDQNGLVLIDEIEASEDIKKLNNAKETMLEALVIINNIVSISSGFKGYISETIDSASVELTNKINEQKKAIEDEIVFINSVLEVYKSIDANMKNRINTGI